MDNKNRVVDDRSLPVERQPYMRPQISDVGSIDEQTHTGVASPGPDAAYS
jgi:hypothetical protein